MAKDYFCKDCSNNNNGWCNVRKCQGLKAITFCAHKNMEVMQPIKPKPVSPSKTGQQLKKSAAAVDHAAIERVVGKIEAIWNIQRQAMAIMQQEPPEKQMPAMMAVITSVSKALEYEKNIHKVEHFVSSMIDMDMIKDFTKMTEMYNLYTEQQYDDK